MICVDRIHIFGRPEIILIESRRFYFLPELDFGCGAERSGDRGQGLPKIEVFFFEMVDKLDWFHRRRWPGEPHLEEVKAIDLINWLLDIFVAEELEIQICLG